MKDLENFENRLLVLESKFDSKVDGLNQGLDRHKSVIGWIFGAISFVVGATSLSVAILNSAGRADTREAIANMQSNAQRATDEMKKQVNETIGEALKKPELQILIAPGTPLNGQEFTNSFHLDQVIIQNSGHKRAEVGSIYLYCSKELETIPGQFGAMATLDTNFPVRYQIRTMDLGVIGAQDYKGYPIDSWLRLNPLATNSATCMLQVYYDAEKPAEARFQIRLK